jgi:hypothetical protein
MASRKLTHIHLPRQKVYEILHEEHVIHQAVPRLHFYKDINLAFRPDLSSGH